MKKKMIFAVILLLLTIQSFALFDYNTEIEWVEYAVKSGDTLWGICKEESNINVQEAVHEVQVKNEIASDIKIGQVIWIPNQLIASKP